MIIISDGFQSNTGGGIPALEAFADEIKADGVRIIALGFNGGPMIYTSTLKKIADDVFTVSLIFLASVIDNP